MKNFAARVTKKRREEARDKIRRYLEAGVSLVWAINPATQTVEVYRLGQNEPELLDRSVILTGEDVIPDFKVPVADLFDFD